MSTPRRPKRFLTAEQKYDVFVRILCGQTTQGQAATELGVDRTVITRIRTVARDGAIAALQASRPGKTTVSGVEQTELVEARAEIARLERTVIRRQAGLPLDDAASGGNPIHGLLGWEAAEILAIYNEWVDTDRSHRKLAHRGSYQGRVWVSPSTVDRVLARNNLALAGRNRPPRSEKRPWPAWTQWRPNQL